MSSTDSLAHRGRWADDSRDKDDDDDDDPFGFSDCGTANAWDQASPRRRRRRHPDEPLLYPQDHPDQQQTLLSQAEDSSKSQRRTTPPPPPQTTTPSPFVQSIQDDSTHETTSANVAVHHNANDKPLSTIVSAKRKSPVRTATVDTVSASHKKAKRMSYSRRRPARSQPPVTHFRVFPSSDDASTTPIVFGLLEGLVNPSSLEHKDYINQVFLHGRVDALPHCGRLLELPGEAKVGGWMAQVMPPGAIIQGWRRDTLEALHHVRIQLRHEHYAQLGTLSSCLSSPSSSSPSSQPVSAVTVSVGRLGSSVLQQQGMAASDDATSVASLAVVVVGSVSIVAFDGFTSAADALAKRASVARRYLTACRDKVLAATAQQTADHPSSTTRVLEGLLVIPQGTNGGPSNVGVSFLCQLQMKDQYHVLLGRDKEGQVVAMDVVFQESSVGFSSPSSRSLETNKKQPPSLSLTEATLRAHSRNTEQVSRFAVASCAPSSSDTSLVVPEPDGPDPEMANVHRTASKVDSPSSSPTATGNIATPALSNKCDLDAALGDGTAIVAHENCVAVNVEPDPTLGALNNATLSQLTKPDPTPPSGTIAQTTVLEASFEAEPEPCTKIKSFGSEPNGALKLNALSLVTPGILTAQKNVVVGSPGLSPAGSMQSQQDLLCRFEEGSVPDGIRRLPAATSEIVPSSEVSYPCLRRTCQWSNSNKAISAIRRPGSLSESDSYNDRAMYDTDELSVSTTLSYTFDPAGKRALLAKQSRMVRSVVQVHSGDNRSALEQERAIVRRRPTKDLVSPQDYQFSFDGMNLSARPSQYWLTRFSKVSTKEEADSWKEESDAENEEISTDDSASGLEYQFSFDRNVLSSAKLRGSRRSAEISDGSADAPSNPEGEEVDVLICGASSDHAGFESATPSRWPSIHDVFFGVHDEESQSEYTSKMLLTIENFHDEDEETVLDIPESMKPLARVAFFLCFMFALLAVSHPGRRTATLYPLAGIRVANFLGTKEAQYHVDQLCDSSRSPFPTPV